MAIDTGERTGAPGTFAPSSGPTGPAGPTSGPTSGPSPYAAYAAGLAPPEVRSDSGRRLDRNLLTTLAVAGALPAVRAPAAWLVVCGIAAAVMLVSASVRRRPSDKGSADVVVVPARVAGRVALGVLNPVNWLTVLFGAAVSLLVGAAAGGAIAAVRWLLVEGPTGVLAAVRAGAWANAATYGAAVGCFFLLRGRGPRHRGRAAALRRITARLPEAAVAGITVLVFVLSAAIVLLGPDVDVGVVRGSDGLGWAPPGLRAELDGVRDDMVAAELSSLTECLDDGQPGLWTAGYTAGNSLADDDVATLVADPARAPDQAAIAGAALAADNHLAPWVERLDVRVGDQSVLVLDRGGETRDLPTVNAARLRGRAFGTPDWLVAVAASVDADRVLTCSARTPF